MKISTKGRYGLRILLDLAFHSSGNPRTIKEIAQSQQISVKYISRLIIPLREAGLIESVRGIQGGLKLPRPPREITILKILETMEGPISIVDCVLSPQVCDKQSVCPSRFIWEQMNQKIREILAEQTLEDIVNRQIATVSCLNGETPTSVLR